VSTSAQIQRIRKTEQRYPADIVNNGHTYEHGYAVSSETITKVREFRRIANKYHVEVLDALRA
jgi:hypothetical protein